ncbi:MAG TPA: hypothetical protein PLN22_05455, partial [Ignavibacteria bacterium]|nr:hypothetical protein [Ignavibacteria bacterium]
MPENKKTNQTSEPNTPVDPNNNKINEEQKEKAIRESPQKTDNTRKAGYDENGKLDNPKFEDTSTDTNTTSDTDTSTTTDTNNTTNTN